MEIDNASTTKANATTGCVYIIHTNKYIKHLPNKPITTNTTYTNGAIEFMRRREPEPSTLRIFCRRKVCAHKKTRQNGQESLVIWSAFKVLPYVCLMNKCSAYKKSL